MGATQPFANALTDSPLQRATPGWLMPLETSFAVLNKRFWRRTKSTPSRWMPLWPQGGWRAG
ncbi:MAG: hypothetical protein AB8E87_09930 [Prochlorococcus sp.]